MKEIMVDSGIWSEEQLVVTGSPHTDHWLLPKSKEKNKIGITTTFRFFDNSAPMGKMDPFIWLDQAEKHGGDGTYYLPPNHAESWVFFEASLGRVFLSLVHTISKKRAESIEIRPHPFGRSEKYHCFKQITDNKVLITKDGSISEWLEDKLIVFSYLSASTLDAVVCGVPAVSLKKLIDPDALRKIPGHFNYNYDEWMWQLESFEQANEYVEAALNGKLKPCREERKFNEFMNYHFFYNREKPAAKLIAEEIKKALDMVRANHLQEKSKPKRIPSSFLLYLMAFARYVYGLLPGKPDISFSYQSWRFWEMKTINKVVRRIFVPKNS
jgi:hypothetical protein